MAISSINLNSKLTYRGAGASILPTNTNWQCLRGIVMHYCNVDEQALLEAGLIDAGQVPGNRFRQSVGEEKFVVRRRKIGAINAALSADHILACNAGFRRFMSGLLADIDLSLVRDEKPDL